MEINAPHSVMKNARRVAVYINSEKQWYPARDSQEVTVLNFLDVLDRNRETYNRMIDEGIIISNELSKRYEPYPGVIYTISYDVTNNESVFYLYGEFSSHLTTIYHSWSTEHSLLNTHPIISKMGTLSEDFKSLLKGS
jgi:hypothetical protein